MATKLSDQEAFISRATVIVTNKKVRERIVSELQSRGVTNILVSNAFDKVSSELRQYPTSLLVLDTAIGDKATKKILELSQCPFKVDTRPIYLIAETQSSEVVGLFSKYNASRLSTGTILGKTIKKDIDHIFFNEAQVHNYRKQLHDIAYLRQENQFEKAETILKEIHEKNPGNSRITLELSENLIETKNYDEAQILLKDLIQNHPKQIRALNLLARIQMKSGDFEAATQMLEKVRVFYPGNVDNLIDLGKCFMHQNKVQEAKDSFRKALAEDPSSKEATQGLGECHLINGNLNAALDFFHDSSNMEIVAAFNNAAVICIKNNQPKKGIQLYQAAINQVGENLVAKSRVIFNLGLGYLKTKNIDLAKKAFAEAVALDPGFEKASFNVGVLSKDFKKKRTQEIDTESLSDDDDIFTAKSNEDVDFVNDADKNPTNNMAQLNQELSALDLFDDSLFE